MKKLIAVILCFFTVSMLVCGTVSAQEDITANPMTFSVNLNTASDISSADQKNSSATFMTLQRGQSFSYTITTEVNATYALSVSSGGKENGVILNVDVNGVQQISAVYPEVTGNYQNWADQDLGELTLSAGENVLTFTCPSNSANAVVIRSMTLTKEIREDLEETPKTFQLNTSTVDVSHASGDYCNENYVTMHSSTQYVEYTVSTKKHARYGISVYSGGKQDGVLLDVSVGGKKQIENGAYENTGDYQKWADQDLGVITLEKGENVIKFSLSSQSTDAVVIKSFKLTEYNEPDVVLNADSATRLEIEDFTNENVSDKAAASGGKWAANTWADSVSPIYMYIGVEQDGFFDLDYVMLKCTSTSLSVVSILIDGEKICDNTGDYIENLDSPDGFNWQYGSVCKFREKAVWLEKGVHTVTVDIASCVGNSSNPVKYKYQIDYLEFVPASGVSVLEFNAVTAEGGRLPYTVRNGFTAYAKATFFRLSKTADEAEAGYTAYIAQYDDENRLVQVEMKKMETDEMKVGETKSFLVPLTVKGNGGTIKAFLFNSVSMAPAESAVAYTEHSFFPESVFDETPVYVSADEVQKGAGTYYDDYSIHNDTYDIDAIFYDSVVGSQSKVFAYIGVPKGASEENPVPAVVCVHGGAGHAFPDWVQKWNDRGYAAIAMTLTGDGPDVGDHPGGSGAGSEVGKHLHPYAGVTCWGNNAFLKDVESASMYQNVLNVIRAHNVLRSYPGVDESKIGITGISWGGVTTTTTIGVDNRFLFAAPVYGAGYLDESETYFSDFFRLAQNTKEWDPANFAARTTVPTLFINSDSDVHFSVNSTTKTSGVTPNSKISIRHNYGHDYVNGWSPQEIYAFADAMVKTGKDPFITVTEAAASGGSLTADVACPEGTELAAVTTYYITTDTLPYGGGSNIDWKKLTDYQATETGIAVQLPEDATYCYATLTDSNGYLISTKFVPVQ